MCDVAMEQQQKESLCLLIPLTTSSFLTCPIFQCTSVSLFSHSVTPWMTYRCSVCQHPALVSFPSSYVAIPAPVPPDLLAKKWHSSESVVCHQKLQFITSKLPEHMQIGSFLPHICLILTLFSRAQDVWNRFFPESVCLLLFYVWANPALQPWSFILFI